LNNMRVRRHGIQLLVCCCWCFLTKGGKADHGLTS
jgi:hypothetical protein